MVNKINNMVKFIMINANILLSFLGLFLFGSAFYLWFADWGQLDPSFFVGTGVIIALFGISIMIVSYIGCQGVNTQARKFQFSVWTGRKILSFHLVTMIFVLIGEILLLQVSLSTNLKFRDIHDQLVANPDSPPPYANFENFFAEKFDKFFFGAASECKTTLYFWFWDWIAGNCPSEIHNDRCQGCHSYSFTFCPANANACFDNGEDYMNATCPYNICRAGIMSYIKNRITIFAIVLLSITVLQAFFIFFDIMIICFHPRDSLQTILYKSGTLAKRNIENEHV